MNGHLVYLVSTSFFVYCAFLYTGQCFPRILCCFLLGFSVLSSLSLSLPSSSPEQFQPGESPPYGSLSQGGASSLPDLTSMEFSSGLDVPLERDDDSPTQQKYSPFHSPGPSKLTTSIQINGAPGQHHPIHPQPHPPHSSYQQHQAQFFIGSHPQTMLPSGYGNVHLPHTQPLPPQHQHQQHRLRQLIPSSSSGPAPLSLDGTSNILPNHSSYAGYTPPFSANQVPVSQHHKLLLGNKLPETSPPSFIVSPPTQPDTTAQTLPNPTPTLPSSSMRSGAFQAGHPVPSFSVDDTALLCGNQLPNAQRLPTFPGNHFDQLQHQQQRLALQQKLAAISMVGPPVRSHSEENLVKIQKEILSSDVAMQQNPFMGNLANASSVPCVYVDPSNVEPCVDPEDSPTTGTGSPSTSASHASSPPLSRPSWIDHPHSMNEFVFHEWPVESQGQLLGEKVKLGSPLNHHKSLTELNKLASEVMLDLSSSYQNKAHQLSLPSIVMSDLTVDEQQAAGPFLSHDLDMEDEVMQSLLSAEGFVTGDGFVPFDVSMLGADNSMPDSTDLFHSRMNY